MTDRFIAVLSGGAGSRLWPMSREKLPKQFFDLTQSGRPLLVETLDRFQQSSTGSLIITTQVLEKSTLGLLKKYGLNAEILGEPCPRNTAPAIAWVTAKVLKKSPKASIGVFPADHMIRGSEAFRATVDRAFKAAEQGRIVTMGIKPSYAATAYGYIEIKKEGSKNGVYAVERFVEKPPAATAEKFLQGGQHLWNAGIFVFSAQAMADAFAKHMPDLWASVTAAVDDPASLASIYPRLASQSIDFGVMEKLDSILCVPADFEWSDLGSWEEVTARRPSGIDVELGGSNNHYVRQDGQAKRTAFVGVSDLVAVDFNDALLVMKKGSGQGVKDVVMALQKKGFKEVSEHDFEERPWGRFQVLLDTAYFKSKLITVFPGEILSYQSHTRRSEHWVVVKGRAKVTLNDQVSELKAGDYVFIPQGAKHRIANPGSEPMDFIEVQTGTYFGEDDIVRYQDSYGRV